MDSAGILDDDSEDTQVPVDEGGGAGESLDPSSPAPEGGGGAAGIGVPYQDYIPFFPMLQDPATGEWRNAEPGEMPGSEGSEPADASGSPQALSHLFDPSAPGPTVDANLFNPNAPGPTLDPRLLLDSDSSGPTIDPALLDLSAPGPTIDPALLDPYSPGATIDASLLDPSAPGETIDAALLDPSAPGPTLDPVQLEQGILQPSDGIAEPLAGVTDRGFADSSLAEEPAHPEPSTPRHDDHDDSLDLG